MNLIKNNIMKFTQEELKDLITGIRFQIDECEKNITHYDNDVRVLFETKRNRLYDLWKKLEQND